MRWFLVLLIAISVPVSALSSEPSNSTDPKQVPLLGDLDYYRSQTWITFRSCSPELPTERAAQTWHQVVTRPTFFFMDGDCQGHFGNGRSEIYIADFSMISWTQTGWVGVYRRSGSEYDILISDEVNGELLDRVLVHELGHALGLGDAYKAHPDECGWSLMLSPTCPDFPMTPTGSDIHALDRIYEYTDHESHSLTTLDTNGNGLIDNEEVTDAVDRWIGARIPTSLLHQAIEAWADQRKVQSSRPETSKEPFNSGLHLQGAQSISIYSLDGTRLAQIPPIQLESWTDRAGPGTYLYRARFSGSFRSGKFAVQP